MQYTSPERHPNFPSSCSLISSSTHSSALSLAPWSLDATSLVSADIPGPVYLAQDVYSTDLAGYPSRHDADHFDPLCEFYPQIYPDTYTPFIAEADQWLKPTIAIQEIVESPHFSSLPSGHVEMTQGSTTGDSSVSDRRGYEIIHQDPYTKGRRAAHIIPSIQYHGFSLSSAYKMEYHNLADADASAWPAIVPVAKKLAIVLCFPGKPRYHRQVHIRRTDSRVLTRAKLASIVAREVQTFLGKVRASNQEPLRHCGADIVLENLVLVDVQHVSKGSLQPTIGIIVK